MTATAVPDAAADATYDVWRTFTRRLIAIAVVSIALAWPLSRMNRAVDGVDPFYVALAWQFAIWGLIDLGFALNGEIGLRRTSRLPPGEREAELASTRTKILGALRFNRWLNAMWIAMAVGLLIWGYAAWSPGLVGHGVGVFVQAIALVVFDRAFYRSLDRPSMAAAI